REWKGRKGRRLRWRRWWKRRDRGLERSASSAGTNQGGRPFTRRPPSSSEGSWWRVALIWCMGEAT
ncbi:unnamed protein product, partial [Musa acuminata var. zebrina]